MTSINRREKTYIPEVDHEFDSAADPQKRLADKLSAIKEIRISEDISHGRDQYRATDPDSAGEKVIGAVSRPAPKGLGQ